MGTSERVDARALIGVLGGWSVGDGPLYRQLAAAMTAAIDRGDLPPGMRLPAERSLADALPAARNTVVAAFGLLVESGHVARRQGSGTTVAGHARPDRPSLAAGLRAQTLTGRALPRDGSPPPVDLGLSVLDDPESLPAWAFDVDPLTAARAGRPHGYAPLGIDALRDRVAGLLTARGLPSTAAQVAITLGAQHGIALAAEVLAARGAVVAIEDPTYPGAIDVYSRAGMRFAAVETDAGGTDPSSLRRVLAGGGVDLVHLAPQCASPTGVVTVASRREQLVDLLASSGTWLVEDAALEFLAPPETHGYLATALPDRTVLVGTTSKVLWGGLRVGWVRAPASVVEGIGRLRAAHDLGSPIAPQVTALRLLDDIGVIAERRRAEATAKRTFLRQRISAAVPEVRVAEPAGGLSLWIEVDDADRLVADAAALGLDIVSGRVCSVSGDQRDRVRISAWAPDAVLDEAARRFAAAWRLGRSDD